MPFIAQVKNKYTLIIIVIAVLIFFVSNGILYSRWEMEKNRLTDQIDRIQSDIENYEEENENLRLENENLELENDNLKLENEIVKTENEDLKEKIEEGLSPDQITNKVISYINQNLLPEGTTASLIDILEESGLYKIKLKIEGDEYDSYVTKDGKILFPSGVSLESN